MEGMVWLPALIIIGCLGCGLFLGFPMAFTLAVSAIVVAFLFMGHGTLGFVALNTYGVMRSLMLVAAPLFIFMACVLERSGVASALYDAMHQWLGPLRGGLAMATVLICTVIAALSGITTTGVVTMGLVALPIMLKLGYNKTIAMGPIMAGGALGILIPPSIPFIIYGMLTKTSVGRLFAGGLIPGLILSFFYITYIGIRCYFRPKLGPAVPKEERVSLRQKVVLSRGVILPVLLVVSVLGSIFGGIASPTEAAAVGAFGSLICAAIHRKLTWQLVKESCYRTIMVTSMCIWILFGALCFCTVFIATGGPELVKGFISGLEVEPVVIILMMMASYFVMGCFADELTILPITVPIYMPILLSLGYDPVWFGVLFMINMQMAYLTPPFGYTLFYMRGIVPPGITIVDIYRSIVPFVVLQWIGLLLVLFFPQLALWLPEKIFQLL